ncbi:MAG: diguanylate cyclase [Candidatus Limnocylindrales bacterium]|jgi:diguanylate cyclase (GGDEF)-like protein/PAS domain S-box-containing protein
MALPRLDPILEALADSERHFRILIEQAADGILVVDGKGLITLSNSQSCEMTGYDPDEIVGLDLLDTYLPEDRDLGRQRRQKTPAGTIVRFERRLRRKDGSSLPVDVSVAWLPDGQSQSIMRDISARKRAEEAQRAEDARLRALVRISGLESGSLAELLDATLEEIVTLSDSVYGYIYYYSEETGEFARHAWSKAVMGACRITNRHQTSRLSEIGIWGEAVRQRRAIVVNDFAAPHPLKRGYPEGHAPLTRFMTVPVVSRGKIVAVVGVANKPTAYTDADVTQLTQMMDVVWKIAERQRAEDDLRRLAEELECRVEERTREFEHANAELEAANTDIGAANAELQQLLREQERLQAELAYRAMHDPLTGLANRIMFGERLDHALRVSDRGVAVVWIDLDHFKEVNDIFGHDVGDEMLVAVAERLRDVVRETDDIARMGGDEFAVILPNVIETEAQMVAERILGALSDRNGFRLQMGASVGIAWQRTSGADGPALVRRADEAMYRAKGAGGGMAVMY